MDVVGCVVVGFGGNVVSGGRVVDVVEGALGRVVEADSPPNVVDVTAPSRVVEVAAGRAVSVVAVV